MTFDPVPWCITGAATDAAVARVLANVASRDSEGVVLPGDMKVTQLATPGGGVQIAAGGLVVRNAQAPGESYVGKASSSTSVTISPTGGSARSDLVIAQVIDPDFAPWSPYTDPAAILAGPYFQPYVIAGVSPTTTSVGQVVSYSGYALARIDIPANTTVITNAMITDLRALAQPRTWSNYDIQSVAGTVYVTTSNTTWIDWPGNSLTVTVPTWATKARVIVNLNGVAADGDVNAYVQVLFGALAGPSAFFDFNKPSYLVAGDYVNTPISAIGVFDVTALQGQSVIVKTQAERFNVGTTTGDMRMEPRHQVIFEVHFTEETV